MLLSSVRLPMIQVTCSNCNIRILVPDTVQGRQGICFGCGARLKVPSSSKPLQDADLAFSKGDRISDRYIIQQPLGKGGMGVVYRAYDTLVGEEVALKFMKPILVRTQKGHKNFIQEAQIARRLRHENIVAVHDVSWTPEGILYLSMEFLKGHSLRSLLRKHRQDRRFMDVRLGIKLTEQTLAALEYAHRTVIHRDLKPENIMVLSGERVKVLDFGLAKAIDEALIARPRRGMKPGRSVGTWAYAAPEQQKRQSVDFRADIYSVGLILYELFTLRTPIDEHVQVDKARNDVSPSLLAVVERAMQTDVEMRWQSAAEFRDGLLEAFKYSYETVCVSTAGSAAGVQVSTENMVYLEGGSFLMGCDDVGDEAPEFETYAEPFYIDKFPVTVKEYAAFVEATGHPVPKFWHNPQYNGPDQPVVGVTWSDANAYAAWIGKQLATEAQWEFAARGTQNRKYPWGRLEPDTTRCNFDGYLGMPSIVTMHEAGMTPDGIHDMAGNVYEWTCEAFLPYDARRNNANAQADVPLRAVRGGCWDSTAKEVRCTHRKGLFPESQLATVGLRCVIPARHAPRK